MWNPFKILREAVRLLEEIRRLLAIVVVHGTTPGRLRLRATSQEGAMLTFAVQVPPFPEPGDVVRGELTVTVAGGEPVTVETGKDDVEVANDAFVGDEGAEVALSYAFVDNVGNRSQPRELTATLVDTIAPDAPGELGVRATGESFS